MEYTQGYEAIVSDEDINPPADFFE